MDPVWFVAVSWFTWPLETLTTDLAVLYEPVSALPYTKQLVTTSLPRQNSAGLTTPRLTVALPDANVTVVGLSGPCLPGAKPAGIVEYSRRYGPSPAALSR